MLSSKMTISSTVHWIYFLEIKEIILRISGSSLFLSKTSSTQYYYIKYINGHNTVAAGSIIDLTKLQDSMVHGRTVSVLPSLNNLVILDSYVSENLPAS